MALSDGEEDMKRRALILLALCFAASAALAQGAGSGLGRGNRGGSDSLDAQLQGLFQVSALQLFAHPAVQNELKLTPEQRTKVNEVLAKARQGRATDVRPGSRPADERPFVREILGLLTPEQRQRFEQISLWVVGAPALAGEGVARRVGLSDEQVSLIRGILREYAQQLRSDRSQAATDRPALRERMQKMRAETEAKILAVLTPEQQKRWDEIRGPKFELPGRIRR
jgi:Spy/CpxP family protein refolding chaperone